MSIFHYCTIASNNHLFKAIAMHNSLASKCDNYRLSILCLNEEVFEVLSWKHWDRVHLLRLNDIEDEMLLTAKSNRSSWEYAWTVKPALLKYIMSNDSTAEYFAFLDADVYFFSNPNDIFYESPGSDIFLTDHNNAPEFIRYYDISGKYNSGFVGCRKCETAMKAVDWWKTMAVDWCYAQFDLEKKRYGDQRYLEEFPVLFPNVHIVENKGVNAAHWNIQNYNVTTRDGQVYLNEDKLIFFHYSGLSIHNSKEYNLSWAIHIPEAVTQQIYLPYLMELKNIIEEVEIIHPAYKDYGFQRPDSNMELHYITI